MWKFVKLKKQDINENLSLTLFGFKVNFVRLIWSYRKSTIFLDQQNWNKAFWNLSGIILQFEQHNLPEKEIHSVIIITKKLSCFQRMHLGRVMCVIWVCRFVYLHCLECLKSKKNRRNNRQSEKKGRKSLPFTTYPETKEIQHQPHNYLIRLHMEFLRIPVE